LTLKAATICFTAFILIAVLLIESDTLAFPQSDHGRRERSSQETADQAEALFQNALRLGGNGDGKSTLPQLQEAVRLWIEIREPRKAAMAALQMGDHYKNARSYPDALTCYRLALGIELLPGSVKATALNSIAQIYAGLYLHDQAVRYFNQAVSQALADSDLPAQTFALAGLADLYRRQGALEKARSFITSALRIGKRGHPNQDPVLLNLNGQISLEQGLVEHAKRDFEGALEIYRNTGNIAGQVKVLCELSTLSLLVSQKQAALEQAESALKLAEMQLKGAVSYGDKVSARELRWPASLSHARAGRALGQPERALRSFASAIADIRLIWWTVYIATEASAVAFREEVQSAYREYRDLLIEQKQSSKAYTSVEESKGRTLLNFTSARQARPRSVDDKQAKVLRDLSRSIALLRGRLRGSVLSRHERAKLQKEIEDKELRMNEARLIAEMEHVKDRLSWSQPATAGLVQEQMTKDQMTLVEFSLGEQRSFLWLFARDELFIEILPSRKEIEEAVRPYLKLLGAQPNPLYIERDLTKLRERSAALFAKLFGGLAGRIKPGQRLIVVPDGLLHYLPFETLIHNGNYLLEDHAVSYVPSAGILLQLQDSKREIGTRDRMELLAFGDPIFSFEPGASISKKHRRSPTNIVRNARDSRVIRLQRLPRTRDEVEYIAALFPNDRTRSYLGKDSTEAAVKRESLRRYRRLHFATHSLIDETSPSRSAVVLTQDDDLDEDGYLEVSEISELDLDCDLVVLSACQTGRGRLLSGEGIIGLSRAFLYAGARAVVVSYWNVSDISTSHLMENLYRHLTAGRDNASALRATKLQMLSKRETTHPYYWASFVIIGKP
jgi:CHAT domain-containing protein